MQRTHDMGYLNSKSPKNAPQNTKSAPIIFFALNRSAFFLFSLFCISDSFRDRLSPVSFLASFSFSFVFSPSSYP